MSCLDSQIRERVKNDINTVSCIYEATFNALPVGATIIKRENPDSFIIQDINSTSASVTSRNPAPKEEVIGVAIDKIFAGVREAGLLDRYNEALDSGSVVHLGSFNYEDPRTPAGIFSIDLIPLSEDELLITFSNVTERVKAEENLKDSEAQFRAMAESSPDHVMKLDLDYRIEYINRTVPDLTTKEVLGTSIFEFVPEEQHDKMRATFDSVSNSGNPDSYLVEYRSNEGDVSLFETTVGPILQNGIVSAFISSSRDITRHREAEIQMNAMALQLLQAQEDERRSISQELHDEIGGLLSAIHISLELIPKEQREAIPEISGLATQVDSLMEQVRSLSLTLRPNSLDELGLEEAIRIFLERFMAQTKITVAFSSDLDLDTRFASDLENAAYRLVQEALTNVARHAQTNRAEIKLGLSDGSLIVQIEDEGTGFDLTDDASSRLSLGISGMHHRASVLGGTVSISAKPGSGTSIHASFPVQQSDS